MRIVSKKYRGNSNPADCYGQSCCAQPGPVHLARLRPLSHPASGETDCHRSTLPSSGGCNTSPACDPEGCRLHRLFAVDPCPPGSFMGFSLPCLPPSSPGLWPCGLFGIYPKKSKTVGYAIQRIKAPCIGERQRPKHLHWGYRGDPLPNRNRTNRFLVHSHDGRPPLPPSLLRGHAGGA